MISPPCLNSNGSPLELGHGWVIASQMKIWMQLSIHATISVSKKDPMEFPQHKYMILFVNVHSPCVYNTPLDVSVKITSISVAKTVTIYNTIDSYFAPPLRRWLPMHSAQPPWRCALWHQYRPHAQLWLLVQRVVLRPPEVHVHNHKFTPRWRHHMKTLHWPFVGRPLVTGGFHSQKVRKTSL